MTVRPANFLNREITAAQRQSAVSACTQPLRVASFKPADGLEPEPELLGWRELDCLSMEDHEVRFVRMPVPETPDGYQARKYLYRKMLNAPKLLQPLSGLTALGAFKFSFYCAFMRDCKPSLLGCISDEISTQLLKPGEQSSAQEWQIFTARCRLYRIY